MSAAEHKAKGNEFFQKEKFAEALEAYNEAIKLAPEDGVLYSNRSATNLELSKWVECLDDATTCLKLKPDWFKAYYRRALALNKVGRNVEARGMCAGGLALEEGNKDLRTLRDQVNEPICVEFGKASAIDFKMDRPPSEDFRTVLKNKLPAKDAQLNGLAFPQTHRTILHVAVMCGYTKVAKELVNRGAAIAREDRMGLSALHMAALIRNEAMLNTLSEFWAENQNNSTTHNASPQDLLDATSFTIQSPKVEVKVLDKDGKAASLDSMAFMKRFQCFYTRTCQLSDDYFRCMYSSVLDDEGSELMANPRKNELTQLFKASTEEKKLGLAFIDDATGFGVFALEAIKKDDYVCAYCGLLAGSDNIKDQPRNGFVITIMPLDKLPFKTDASLYRSLGGFLNHADEGNVTPEHIVAKGAPMVAFVANKDIAAGEQITYDYRGRLHAIFCEKNIPNFKAMGPLPAAGLASLQKL